MNEVNDHQSDRSGPGGGEAGTSGYRLHYLIAVLERMNGLPAVIEIKSEPEDESHWVRQAPFDTAA